MRRGVHVCAILFVVLGGAALPLHAQQTEDEEEQEPGVLVEQNETDPFNPSTRIPFILEEELFQGEQPVVVSVRIFNVLQHLVSEPVANNHKEGNRVPLDELEYSSPGRQEAFWDGLDQFGRKVVSGVYFLQLIVNGRSHIKKMLVGK
jgi:hypothetical protein